MNCPLLGALLCMIVVCTRAHNYNRYEAEERRCPRCDNREMARKPTWRWVATVTEAKKKPIKIPGVTHAIVKVCSRCKGPMPHKKLARINTLENCGAFDKIVKGKTYLFQGYQIRMRGRMFFVVDNCDKPIEVDGHCPLSMYRYSKQKCYRQMCKLGYGHYQ